MIEYIDRHFVGARFGEQLLHCRNLRETARTLSAILVHEIEHEQRRVLVSTGTALSSGASGVFTLAHSSMILAAWAGEHEHRR